MRRTVKYKGLVGGQIDMFGAPTMSFDAIPVSRLCACGRYDPTGGGYWPMDFGPFWCREHLPHQINTDKEKRDVPAG